MNRCMTFGLAQLVLFLLSSSLVSCADTGLRQEETSQFQLDTPIPPQNAPRPERPAFTQPELDQMLAPIALYPDALLSQILMASTYPIEVIEAARWSKANPTLKGEQVVQAVTQQTWDQSVKSLVAFPQVLTVMDDQLPWMERLGDAFLAQQQQVMETVQNLRQKASAAGNLTSNDQIRVAQQGQSIVIQPVNPQVVYVPYYNPMSIYGPWWWSAYPPIYWGMWPGYFYGSVFGLGCGWGMGIGIGPGFFFSGFNWQSRYATFAGRGLWAHDPFHRRGVPYRDLALSRQFGRMGASSLSRSEFHGHEPSSGERRTGLANRTEERSGSPGHSNESGGAGPRGATQPHAFEGISHGSAERDFGMRGQASSHGFGGGSFGGFRGGGGHR